MEPISLVFEDLVSSSELNLYMEEISGSSMSVTCAEEKDLFSRFNKGELSVEEIPLLKNLTVVGSKELKDNPHLAFAIAKTNGTFYPDNVCFVCRCLPFRLVKMMFQTNDMLPGLRGDSNPLFHAARNTSGEQIEILQFLLDHPDPLYSKDYSTLLKSLQYVRTEKALRFLLDKLMPGFPLTEIPFLQWLRADVHFIKIAVEAEGRPEWEIPGKWIEYAANSENARGCLTYLTSRNGKIPSNLIDVKYSDHYGNLMHNVLRYSHEIITRWADFHSCGIFASPAPTKAAIEKILDNWVKAPMDSPAQQSRLRVACEYWGLELAPSSLPLVSDGQVPWSKERHLRFSGTWKLKVFTVLLVLKKLAPLIDKNVWIKVLEYLSVLEMNPFKKRKDFVEFDKMF